VTEPDRPAVPWRGRDALAVAVVTLFLVIFAAVVTAGSSLTVLLAIQAGILGAVTLLWARLYRSATALLGRRFRVGLTPALVALGVGLASFLAQILFAVTVITAAGGEVPEGAGTLPPSAVREAPVAVAIGAVVLAPFAEELFFRGLLLQGLWRSFGRWPAILVSAAIFGLAHIGPSLLGSVLSVGSGVVAGVALGWAFSRSENLAVSVVAHGTINAVALLLSTLAG